jgi:hypothetical protein
VRRARRDIGIVEIDTDRRGLIGVVLIGDADAANGEIRLGIAIGAVDLQRGIVPVNCAVLVMPRLARSSCEMALMAIGTRIMDSDRRCAVTMMSPDAGAEGAGCVPAFSDEAASAAGLGVPSAVWAWPSPADTVSAIAATLAR